MPTEVASADWISPPKAKRSVRGISGEKQARIFRDLCLMNDLAWWLLGLTAGQRGCAAAGFVTCGDAKSDPKKATKIMAEAQREADEHILNPQKLWDWRKGHVSDSPDDRLIENLVEQHEQLLHSGLHFVQGYLGALKYLDEELRSKIEPHLREIADIITWEVKAKSKQAKFRERFAA